MNKLDKQYTDLLQDILDNGVTKKDRTGTGTISVFGRQIRHKMSDGFPLLTTKKMHFKSIVTELLWFLKGDTSIEYLLENDCHIWDGDCFANYVRNFTKYVDSLPEDSETEFIIDKDKFINRIKTDGEFAKKWGDLGPIYGKQWRKWTKKKMPFKTIVTELLWFLQGRTDLRYLLENNYHIWTGDAYKVYDKDFDAEYPPFSAPYPSRLTMQEFEQKIMDDDEFNRMYGDLGSIYGKQWRSWEHYDEIGQHYSSETQKIEQSDILRREPIDQIQNLINDLKTNPDSRRLLVSAWAVHDLPKMTLPPCHYGFQIYTRELTFDERKALVKPIPNLFTHGDCDVINLPKRAISLMWNQRSCDLPLGIPFNIASYALLLEIIAKMVNMIPDELIGNLGDCHIYLNQIDGVKEQIGRELSLEERKQIFEDRGYVCDLWPFNSNWSGEYDGFGIPKHTREPYPLPNIIISDEVNFKGTIDDFLDSCSKNSFKLHGYQSHPPIKIPLSN